MEGHQGSVNDVKILIDPSNRGPALLLTGGNDRKAIVYDFIYKYVVMSSIIDYEKQCDLSFLSSTGNALP